MFQHIPCMCTGEHVCDQRTTKGVLSLEPSPCLFGLPLAWHSADRLYQLANKYQDGIFLSSPPRGERIAMHSHAQLFYVALEVALKSSCLHG